MDADLSDYGFPSPRPAVPVEDESWYHAGPLEVESPPPRRIEPRAHLPIRPSANSTAVIAPARRLTALLVLGVLAFLSGAIIVAALRLSGKLPGSFWPH